MSISVLRSETDATTLFTLSHNNGETEFKFACTKPFNAELDHFSLFWLGRPSHECLSDFINISRQQLVGLTGGLFFFDHSKHRIPPRLIETDLPSVLERTIIEQYENQKYEERLRFVRYELYSSPIDTDDPNESRCAVWGDLWGARNQMRLTEVGLYAMLQDFRLSAMRTATRTLLDKTLSLPRQIMSEYLYEIEHTLEGATV